MKLNIMSCVAMWLLTITYFTTLSYADYVLYNNKKELNEPPDFTGTKTYHDSETNKKTSSYHYIKGERNGPYAEWDAQTGELREEGIYLNGQLNGIRKTYRNGKLEMEHAYDKGESSGVQKEYRDGVLSRVYLMRKSSDMPDTELYFNKNGQLTSLHCGIEKIGAKDAEWCGRKGKLSTVTLYDDKGRVSATVQYLSGLQSGVARKFNLITGKVMSEEHYEKGKQLKGGQKHFNKEGILLSKTDCDNSDKSCTEANYFENGGQVKQTRTWEGGKITHETKYYQNGKQSYDRVAQGDHFLITTFYDSGKTENRGLYEADFDGYVTSFRPDGVIESFNGNGVLRARETYVHGRLQGQSDFYRLIRNHKVHEESIYKDDKLVGRKLFIDDRPVSESEYMPDGSIRSRKVLDKTTLSEFEDQLD